jgi:uncharacterized membrane protein
MGGPGFGGFLGPLFGLLFLVGVAILIVMIVRAMRHGGMGHSGMGHGGMHHYMGGPEDPASIVKRRLANGEITPEQYDQIMSKLGA